jgi:hypothetical protein
MFPKSHHDVNVRVKVGGADCLQPYKASIFNISAMSYGALSKQAITSLNEGAKKVRMDEERSDELRTLALRTKAVQAHTSIQDAHPP